LRHPVVRRAWLELLVGWLPPGVATILDAGCGTGTLSLPLAGLGHRVTGIDWSPAMIALAQAKADAAGRPVEFMVGDVANPQLAPARYDVILSRHVLWALPEPAGVVRRWAKLLAPEGQLILIEGYWHTGGGLHTEEVIAALPPSLMDVTVHDLSDQPSLWGGAVSDERYAVVATLRGGIDPSPPPGCRYRFFRPIRGT